MRETLIAAGYEVDDARNGADGLDKVREFHPDLVLLDINMPEMSGVDVCKSIRADSNIAIIMLTVRKSDADKVAALDAETDDFITKPFSTPELLARMRAALRRVPVLSGSNSKIHFGELVIDFGARTVTRGATSTHLTPKEFVVLRHLTQHANEAVSHRELLQFVWGPGYGDEVDYLRDVIRKLRKKIELNPEQPQYIKTEPWVGYRFNTTPESS
jgi:two-component system KDP operon response regulator KdpE